MKRLAMLLATVVPVALTAQTPTLLPGSRLRVNAPGYGSKITGTLMSQTPDTIEVAEAGAVLRRIPWTSVREVRASTGKSHGAGAAKGAMIGAIAGGAVAGVSLLFISSDNGSYYDFSGSVFVAMGAAVGAEWGVVIGGIIGAEKWQRVYSAPLRISVAPLLGPAAIGISARF